jgi:hypothetical protein
MSAVPKEIKREDIERKFRELQGDIEHAGASLKSYAMVAGAVVAVTVVGVAFLLGRRRGKRRSTVVEIRRI